MDKFEGLRKWTMLFISMVVVVLLAACGGNEAKKVSNNTSEMKESQEIAPVKLVLNWFPAAGHGGIYAAEKQGFFEKNGLDVTIEPGGPQISSIQIVSSGGAQFGLAHGDQIVVARNQGIELVALAAINQRSPQAFMFHKGHGIKGFDELNGRTAFIQPGITYWEYLKSKYDVKDVKELAFTGQHTNFMQDVESVNQVYVTSEPFFMKQQGLETEVKLISDSGYDPYNYVLYVTKDYLENNKETVQQFVSAFVEGWNYYKDSPDETLKLINEINPDKSMESLEFENSVLEDYVYGGDAAEYGVGYMTNERWSTLIEQLHQAGVLDETFDASDMFTTEFLPKK